jgi:hypothetical protein
VEQLQNRRCHRSTESEEQFQLKLVGQQRINASEVSQGSLALMGLQLAKVRNSQLETTLIQLRIHKGSPAIGSNREARRGARVEGQIPI